MNRMLIAVAGLVAFLSGAPDTWAFTTQPVTSDAMSNRLADPEQLPDKTSNGQSGGTTFGVPGGHLMLQFSAPPSSGTFEQPIYYQPQLGIRAERTSIGPNPGGLLADQNPARRGATCGKSAPRQRSKRPESRRNSVKFHTAV